MRGIAILALAPGCADKLPTPATLDSGSTPTSQATTPDPGDDDDDDDTTTSTTSSTTSSTTTGTTTTTVDDSVQQLCVDEINVYRATIGLPPYARWTSAEACADDQAESDSQTGIPHGAFGSCGEWAQNECPGWWGPEEDVIVDCLAMMWAEGPGADFQTHGHYINMSSTTYTEVACGFYTTTSGSVWAVQDFR